MKKLKGHKPACKCVGCSAETRRRGMKALGLQNPARVSKGAGVKGARIAGKSRKSRRKLLRKARAAFERLDRIVTKTAKSKSFPNPRRVGRYTLAQWRKMAREGFPGAKVLVAARKRLAKKRAAARRKINREMAGVRYAGGSRRTFTPAMHRKIPNPARNLIGTSPVLHTSRGTFRYPGARLVTGGTPQEALIVGIRSRARYVPIGSRVRAVDYTHDAKAMRAYGRRAPFRHKFTRPARVFVAGHLSIGIQSESKIWEKQ